MSWHPDLGLPGFTTVSNTCLLTDSNQIIIKTYPGMAQAIAAAIDGIEDESVLGCVAGDDAIIVITRDIESAERVGADIRRLIRENN